MGKYEQINHTADLAISVVGVDFIDLTRTAAIAWRDLVFGKKPLRNNESVKFEVKGETKEELLVNFLSELNYLLHVKKWICNEVKQLLFVDERHFIRFKAILAGETYQAKRHDIQVEIKAVTFHQIDIKNDGHQLRTTIVFDI